MSVPVGVRAPSVKRSAGKFCAERQPLRGLSVGLGGQARQQACRLRSIGGPGSPRKVLGTESLLKVWFPDTDKQFDSIEAS
ncbi:hypothetical protein NDU88_001643 [Pleurodeles waltl]|uniref:Uncharacterized protein n=1 Tax=Pleurodeles waltl TaxID=8319 RepID=A0AAV7MLI3_PLEWA|nr:hypothetical protein NDU88_001643 [Pleurodeles waltl]